MNPVKGYRGKINTPKVNSPMDIDTFSMQANHCYCYFLDNMSYISQELSDTLCRIVTGASLTKRELFTDDEDVFFTLRRVVGFNGVAQFANQPDLLDRSLILQMDRIKGDKRRDELDLKARFEAAKPGILGGIFDTLSHMISTIDKLEVKEDLPRMADYYRYAVAAAVGLGYGAKSFKNAFSSNVLHQHQEALNASSMATLIMEYMNDKEDWKGGATVLYVNLKSMAEERGLGVDFPRNASWLWRRIAEAKTTLEACGVDADKDDSVRPRAIILHKNTSYIRSTYQNSPEHKSGPLIFDLDEAHEAARRMCAAGEDNTGLRLRIATEEQKIPTESSLKVGKDEKTGQVMLIETDKSKNGGG